MTAFGQRLEQAARLADTRLAALMDEEAAGGAPQRLIAAMRHALLAGGKRIRPFLVLESAALFGIERHAALDAAAAVECVHCYSLVHDDLPAMDDDALRRGQPTVHVAFDEATAILAGDALLTFAFDILARTQTHEDPGVRAALALQLARAGGARGMAGGQMIDLSAEGRSLSEDEIRALQEMKTGALIRAACMFGPILAGAGEGERAALASYADAIGLAFQVADDLLDVHGDAAQLGKAAGKDEAAGKATFVALLGADGARDLLTGLERQAAIALKPFGDRAASLREAAAFIVNRKK